MRFARELSKRSRRRPLPSCPKIERIRVAGSGPFFANGFVANGIASAEVEVPPQLVVSQPLTASAAKTAVAPRFCAVRNTARCFVSASASSRPPLYYFAARALIGRDFIVHEPEIRPTADMIVETRPPGS